MKKLIRLIGILLLLTITQAVFYVIGIYTIQQFRHGVNIFSNYGIFMIHMKETLLPGLMVCVPSAFFTILIINIYRKNNK